MGEGTNYARNGDVHIAYRTLGDGPIDVVFSLGFYSHLEHNLAEPHLRDLFERIAAFSRLILFDRRGVGLSDAVTHPPTLEEQVDDVRAVMDAVGGERAALMGHAAGGSFAALFAASMPERVSHLILYSAFARMTWDTDYTWANTPEQRAVLNAALLEHWGTGEQLELIVPSMAENAEFREWFAALQRLSCGPGAARMFFDLMGEIDVRPVLASIAVPTLVLHVEDAPMLDARHAKYLTDHIAGAVYRNVPGVDNFAVQPRDRAFVADEVEEFLTGRRGSATVDRILSTVLFTDIVGSTNRAAELGDSGWREVLDNHDVLVRRQFERYRGREVKTTGDGFFAAFDGPERAVRCALAIQASSAGNDLPLRVGLHTGECEVRGDDLGGMAVHIGARVADLAVAGEVLVSRTVRDLVVGSDLSFSERGEHDLKGVPGSWQLFAAS